MRRGVFRVARFKQIRSALDCRVRRIKTGTLRVEDSFTTAQDHHAGGTDHAYTARAQRAKS